MIRADDYLAAASARGFDYYTGVPCSFLTPMINRVIGDPATRYVGAASEGEAVAIAAGAWLAGRLTTVMCQNSGLGNAVNPLTSLNHPFRIPTLMIVTWRGEPGLGDEPQHELMGEVTGSLLDTIQVPRAAFPAEGEAIAGALDAACAEMAAGGLPYAFVMAKGSVEDIGLDATPPPAAPAGEARDLRHGGPPPARYAVLEQLLVNAGDEVAFIATTGKCGRELFTLADRAQHLYQVGSMGCALGMGLGVAGNVRRPVVVLDGDGAMLMKLGTLATVGAEAPENLVHVVLDNGLHDSTGGQPTVSPGVDFAAAAVACGYRTATRLDDAGAAGTALATALAAPGPHMLHVRVAPGSLAKLGRPTVKPPEVARRFKDFLARR